MNVGMPCGYVEYLSKLRAERNPSLHALKLKIIGEWIFTLAGTRRVVC